MITDDIRLENLKEKLKEITGIAYFNNNELITLCPICEKQRFHTNRNHGHLYINKINPIFHCYRCNFKGIIYKVFNEFKLDINEYIDSENLIYKKDFANVDKFINKEFNNNIKFEELDINDEKYKIKLNYLKNRIPDFEYNENIILDIEKFINYNNIKIDIEDSFRKYLYNNFVGFLGSRKSLLICRNIDSESFFRYYKIKLKDIFFKDIYSIEINKDSNKIALCEGVFDLHNILKNKELYNLIKDFRCISTALNNDYLRSFISTLDYYKIVFSDDVFIFSDKDVLEYRYMNLYFNNSCNRLTLFYNESEKDFGTKNIKLLKVPIKKYWKKDNYKNVKKEKSFGI